MKKVHFASGLGLTIFISLHLLNHLFALHSPAAHMEAMSVLRLLYQNPVVEIPLLLCVGLQIVSGIQLVRRRGWKQVGMYNKLHVYSGIYLGFFLLMHTSATLVGRFFIQIDTNFYYAAMVVKVKPYLFFYIPYYMLGVISFFVHLACILRLRIIQNKKGLSRANNSAKYMIGFGILIAILIIIGLTYKVILPKEYYNLIVNFSY